jgi:hypothetical protein
LEDCSDRTEAKMQRKQGLEMKLSSRGLDTMSRCLSWILALSHLDHLSQWFLTGGFCLQGIFTNAWRHFWSSQIGCYRHPEGIEAREAAKHSLCTVKSPQYTLHHQIIVQSQNVNRTEVNKPWILPIPSYSSIVPTQTSPPPLQS